MRPARSALALTLSLAAGAAGASEDSCWNWCGEFPAAYLLAPMNDSRTNLGLLLEDLGVVAYSPKGIPFHYTDFLAPKPEPAPGADEPADEEPVTPPLPPNDVAALAQALGAAPAAASAALERLAGGGYGRCISDAPQSVEAFLRAVQGTELPAADRAALATERLRLAGLCDNATEGAQPLTVSEPARPFARYLEGAAAFYAGQFDVAGAAFQALSEASSPWLREAALYMQGRVALNQAQTRFDDWGVPDSENIDKPFIAQATAAFEAYLQAYPEGLYAASARGLFRKLHWLVGDHAALAAEYQRRVEGLKATADPNAEALGFIHEIESKASPIELPLEALWPAPILAATGALASWRPPDVGADADEAANEETEAVAGEDKAEEATADEPPADKVLPSPPASGEVIAAHRGAFAPAGLEGLGEYLELAHRYWIDHDYAGVIQATEGDPATVPGTNRAFSRAALRGLALMAQQRLADAEGLWLRLIQTAGHPGRRLQAQWLLALTWQAGGQWERIYAADSPVGAIAGAIEVQEYLVHQAPPALMEGLLKRPELPRHLRSLAYFHLVNQHIRQRRFGEAERVLSTYPIKAYELENDALAPLAWQGPGNGYTCPPLVKLVGQLKKSPASPQALNCMGDFLRQKGWDRPPAAIVDAEFDEGSASAWRRPADYGLPPAEQEAATAFVPSLAYYREVIDRPGSVNADDVAYALHRATTCFAYSGNNHCGEQEVKLETRAAWFRRLKSRLGSTSWAKGQKFYW